MKYFLIPITLLFLYSNSNAQKRKAAPTLNARIIGYYLNMKNSLILSNQEQTAKGADSIMKIIPHGKLDSVSRYAAQLSAAPTINLQRKLFNGLSLAIWSLVKQAPGQDKLYLQVCPMTGVSWLSSEKEIRNPYYPKNMLSCGEIKGQSGI